MRTLRGGGHILAKEKVLRRKQACDTLIRTGRLRNCEPQPSRPRLPDRGKRSRLREKGSACNLLFDPILVPLSLFSPQSQRDPSQGKSDCVTPQLGLPSHSQYNQSPKITTPSAHGPCCSPIPSYCPQPLTGAPAVGQACAPASGLCTGTSPPACFTPAVTWLLCAYSNSLLHATSLEAFLKHQM